MRVAALVLGAMLTESTLQIQTDIATRCAEASRIPEDDYAGRNAWQLGLATAMLAEAHREINRLRAELARERS